MSARGRYVLTVYCDGPIVPHHVGGHVGYHFEGDTRADAIRSARAAGWRIRTNVRDSAQHRAGAYSGKAVCRLCAELKREPQ